MDDTGVKDSPIEYARGYNQACEDIVKMIAKSKDGLILDIVKAMCEHSG